jgi:hypothetical protein
VSGSNRHFTGFLLFKRHNGIDREPSSNFIHFNAREATSTRFNSVFLFSYFRIEFPTSDRNMIFKYVSLTPLLEDPERVKYIHFAIYLFAKVEVAILFKLVIP